jgi:hypothetical protein
MDDFTVYTTCFNLTELAGERYYAFTGRGSITPILHEVVVQGAKNPAGVTTHLLYTSRSAES